MLCDKRLQAPDHNVTCATVSICPAIVCRAEEVAARVGDQAGVRICAISEVKADQGGGGAGIAGSGLGDLEHRTYPISRPEEVAARVGDQAGVWVRATIEPNSGSWSRIA